MCVNLAFLDQRQWKLKSGNSEGDLFSLIVSDENGNFTEKDAQNLLDLWPHEDPMK